MSYRNTITRLAADPNEPNAHNEMGKAHFSKGHYNTAILHFRRAFELAAKQNDVSEQAAARNNMGACYLLAAENGEDDALFVAECLFNEALAAFIKLDDWPRVGMINANLGNVDAKRGQTHGAKGHLWKAVEVLKQCGERRMAGRIRQDMADSNHDFVITIS